MLLNRPLFKPPAWGIVSSSRALYKHVIEINRLELGLSSRFRGSHFVGGFALVVDRLLCACSVGIFSTVQEYFYREIN